MHLITDFKKAMNGFERAAQRYWLEVLHPQHSPSADNSEFYHIIPTLFQDIGAWTASLTSLEQPVNTLDPATAFAFNVDLLGVLSTIRMTLASYERQLLLMLAAQPPGPSLPYLDQPTRDSQLRDNMRTQVENMDQGIRMLCIEIQNLRIAPLLDLTEEELKAALPSNPPSSKLMSGASFIISSARIASPTRTSGPAAKRPRLALATRPSSPGAQSGRASLSGAATPSGIPHTSTGATATALPAGGLFGALQSFILAMIQYQDAEAAVRTTFADLLTEGGPVQRDFRDKMAAGRKDLAAMAPLVQNEIK